MGYWENPEATEETFGGGWFHSKDGAQQDEDGYSGTPGAPTT